MTDRNDVPPALAGLAPGATAQPSPSRPALQAASPQSKENPWAAALVIIAALAVVIGFIMIGLGVDARDSSIFEDPDAGILQVVVGQALIGFGALALLSWLAVGAINWQIRNNPR